MKSRAIDRTCPQCGNTFAANLYLIRYGEKHGRVAARCCSAKCRADYRRNPARRHMVTCVRCSKQFDDWANRVLTRKYCSKECARTRAEPAGKTCLVCGIAYTVIPSHSAESKTCSRKCAAVRTAIRQRKSGKEERTRLCTKRWKSIRRQVLERDAYRCTECGIDRGRIHVHHKVPWRDSRDDSLENLITLCNSCHMTAEMQINPRHKYHAKRQAVA